MCKPNQITVSKRIIAFILLVSQVLTSCINSNVPSGQELVDVEKKVNKQRNKLEHSKDNSTIAKRTRELPEIPSISLTEDKRLALIEANPSAVPIVSQRPITNAKSSIIIKNEPTTLVGEQRNILPSSQPKQQEELTIKPKPSARLGKCNNLDAHRKQAQHKRTRQTKVFASPQISSHADTPELLIEELDCLTFTAQGGHQLNLMLVEDQLIAVVNEQLFIGFTRPSLSLPVYVEPGFNISKLKNYSVVGQQAHIEVIFPERGANGKGYVYIGKRGGLGGMKKQGGSKKKQDGKGGCQFGEDEMRPDPDNPGKWVCPGKGKHPRTPKSTSNNSSSQSTSFPTSSQSTRTSNSTPRSEYSSDIRGAQVHQEMEAWKRQKDKEWEDRHQAEAEARRRFKEEIAAWNSRIYSEISDIKKAVIDKYKDKTSKGSISLNGLKEIEEFLKEVKMAIDKIYEQEGNLKDEYGTLRKEYRRLTCDSSSWSRDVEELWELYNSAKKLEGWRIFLKKIEGSIQQEADVLYKLSELHNDSPDNHEDIDKVIVKAREIKSQISSAIKDIEGYGTNPEFTASLYCEEMYVPLYEKRLEKEDEKYEPSYEAKKLQISGLKEAYEELTKIIARFEKRKTIVKPGFKKVAEFAAQQAVQYIQTRGAELARLFDYPVESYDVEVRPKEGKNIVSYQEFEAVFPDNETASIEKFLEIMEAVIVGKGRGMQDSEATRINFKLKSSEPLKLAAIDLMNYNAFVEGSNKELEKAIEKVNQLIKEGTNSAAIVEEGNKFRKKLQEVIQRLRDYKTKQDKKENLDYLLGMEKEMEEKIKLEEHKIFIKNINEEVDRAGARTGELAKSGNDPLATIQEANKFKDKLEEMIERVRRYEHNRDKIIGNLRGIIKEVEQIINEQKEKLDKLEKEKKAEETKIRKEWDKLLDEVQEKFGHLKINSLEEGLRAQEQFKAYETIVKSYEKYSFISRSSLKQVLEEFEKGYKKVAEILESYQDKANYDALIDEGNREIGPLAEELNRLQDERVDEAVIVAKAKEVKPKIEAAIRRLEELQTKQDKSGSLANLQEAKSQVEGVIRDYSQRKGLLAKYKSALQQAAQYIKKQLDEEKEEIARKTGKPVEKYSLTIAPKPGLNLSKLQELFPDENNKVDLQKLLDTVDIEVEILPEEGTTSRGEKEDKEGAGKEKEEDVATNRENEDKGKEKEQEEKEEEKGEARKNEEEAKKKVEEEAKKKAEEKDKQSTEAAVKEKLVTEIKAHLTACEKDADFTKLREGLLMIQENIKQNPNSVLLKALHKEQLANFHSHPLYQQSIELGIQVAVLRREAEEKSNDELIRTAGTRYNTSAGVAKAHEYKQEADAIKKEILEPLRAALGCPNTPRGERRTAEGIKGFGESFYDTGKTFLVDLPILLAKVEVKEIESLIKWGDKLGVKEGCINLGKACKALFDQVKQDWEDPDAYEARMQAVRELEKRQDLFRRAFDAENYHLGQDRIIGYAGAEMIQFLFGGEILKGAAKGASKGAQFFRKVQQGVKVEEGVVEGVKLVERAAEGAKLMEEGKKLGEMGKGIQIGEEAIKMGEYKVTKAVAENIGTRPYINSPSTIIDIMKSGEGVPDMYFKGGMNYKVLGSFQSSKGIFELGINPETNMIYHFVFKALK
ncbi:MAG: hypothetical protein BGO68_02755 [Candidatus Amoebophilus sp. 36-38]|nr:MAG: hypothetical protein BGO68_02755 [Candidatus Amoebophilus sp. 36-38]